MNSLAVETEYDPAKPPRTKACSFRSLRELLADNASIPYLMQFMESKGAHHLLRFWLEADMFYRSSQVLRLGSHANQRYLKAKDRKCITGRFERRLRPDLICCPINKNESRRKTLLDHVFRWRYLANLYNLRPGLIQVTLQLYKRIR